MVWCPLFFSLTWPVKWCVRHDSIWRSKFLCWLLRITVTDEVVARIRKVPLMHKRHSSDCEVQVICGGRAVTFSLWIVAHCARLRSLMHAQHCPRMVEQQCWQRWSWASSFRWCWWHTEVCWRNTRPPALTSFRAWAAHASWLCGTQSHSGHRRCGQPINWISRMKELMRGLNHVKEFWLPGCGLYGPSVLC